MAKYAHELTYTLANKQKALEVVKLLLIAEESFTLRCTGDKIRVRYSRHLLMQWVRSDLDRMLVRHFSGRGSEGSSGPNLTELLSQGLYRANSLVLGTSAGSQAVAHK